MMELKPCPFCGVKLLCREEIWRHKITGITKKYPVYIHPKTGCVLDHARYHFYNDPSKIKAWNRRADNEAEPVRHGKWIGTHDGWYYSYSCSECGAEALTKEETMHDQVRSAYCPFCGAKMDKEA